MSTKTQKELIGSYTELLETMHVHPNEKGLLSLNISTDELEHNIPVTINEKRLVLPTKDNLSNLKDGSLMAFHPLGEHTLRGESEVIKWLKNNIKFNLSYAITNLLLALSDLSVDKDKQKKTTSKQGEFLKLASDANDKTNKAMMKLLDKQTDQLISLYNKRDDGEKDGVEYRRLVVVNYPILEEFENDGTKVYGVELGSKKNKAALKAIFEYVLRPDIDFNEGSDSDVAPYFISMIKFYEGYLTHLNSLVHTFRKFIPDSSYLKINNMEAFDAFMDDSILTKYKRAIPALEGNVGAGGDEEEPTAKEPAPKRNRIMPSLDDVTNNTSRTVEETNTIKRRSEVEQREEQVAAEVDGKVSWQDMMGSINQGQQQQQYQPRNLGQYQQPQQPIQRGGSQLGGGLSGGSDWRNQLGLPSQPQQSIQRGVPRGGFATGTGRI